VVAEPIELMVLDWSGVSGLTHFLSRGKMLLDYDAAA
jgi:hypothetical protein